MIHRFYSHKFTDEYENAQNVIKFTNYKSQIWVECEIDEENNILILNLKSISKINNESTRVEPFRTYQDLEKILNYFKENEMYHHWFTQNHSCAYNSLILLEKILLQLYPLSLYQSFLPYSAHSFNNILVCIFPYISIGR